MDYLNVTKMASVLGGSKVHTTARALLVFFVAMALLTAIPMSSPDVSGARLINDFEDGEEEKILKFTTIPLPGERQTVYIKVKADSTVVSAQMNASGLAFGREIIISGGVNDRTAFRVDLSGDIDNDGYDDYVVTAPDDNTGLTGSVFVMRGSSTGIITPANVTLTGPTTNARMGFGMSSGGDINNDGYDDIVAGAIEVDGTGAAVDSGSAYLYWGGSFPINTTYAKALSQGVTGHLSRGTFSVGRSPSTATSTRTGMTTLLSQPPTWGTRQALVQSMSSLAVPRVRPPRPTSP
jgi:hypothetical protein